MDETMSDWNPDEKHWSIMTKSRGGVVSVIRDLTLDEARKVYERLDPWYGVVAYSGEGNSRHCQDSDIDVREVFGPPGWSQATDLRAAYWPRIATEEEQAQHEKSQEQYREMMARMVEAKPEKRRGWLG
jgi:hypothetical protein